MYYYAGSQVALQWTNQHGCGANSNVHCEAVIQYMCETENEHLRDGTPKDVNDAATDTIPDDWNKIDEDNKGAKRYGYHEPHTWYHKCKTRSRNHGIFIADRKINKHDARGTRQNNNGNRRGLECPEERDYYPYWTPTPWRDIAVLVDDPSRCDYFKKASNNVQKLGECVLDADLDTIKVGTQIGLWNAATKTFVKMSNRGYLEKSRVDTDGYMDTRWTWEKFHVLDAGNGLVALFNPIHNQYIMMPPANETEVKVSAKTVVTANEYAVMAL